MTVAKMLSSQKLQQLARFVATGFIGLLVDFFFTWLFKDFFYCNKFVANGVGFSLAVVNNYVLNRFWTFKSQDKSIAKQFVFFVIISLIGLALNTTLLFLIHQKMQLHFYLSKVLVVVIVFAWNYTANSIFTFKES